MLVRQHFNKFSLYFFFKDIYEMVSVTSLQFQELVVLKCLSLTFTIPPTELNHGVFLHHKLKTDYSIHQHNWKRTRRKNLWKVRMSISLSHMTVMRTYYCSQYGCQLFEMKEEIKMWCQKWAKGICNLSFGHKHWKTWNQTILSSYQQPKLQQIS